MSAWRRTTCRQLILRSFAISGCVQYERTPIFPTFHFICFLALSTQLPKSRGLQVQPYGGVCVPQVTLARELSPSQHRAVAGIAAQKLQLAGDFASAGEVLLASGRGRDALQVSRPGLVAGFQISNSCSNCGSRGGREEHSR